MNQAATLHDGNHLADSTDEQLVARVRGADEEALLVLLDRYRPRIRTWAGKYYAPFGDRDDLVQEALIAFHRAVLTYDESTGTPFVAFARLCVHRGLCSYIRSNLGRRHHYLNDALSIEGDEVAVSEGGGRGDTAHIAVSRVTLAEVVQHARAMLSSLEFAVLMGHAEGSSYLDLASRLGASVKAIDNALQRARRKVLDTLDVNLLAS